VAGFNHFSSFRPEQTVLPSYRAAVASGAA
jgi:hypothetical protein